MLRAKCLHGRDRHVMVRVEWSHQVLAGEMFEGCGKGGMKKSSLRLGKTSLARLPRGWNSDCLDLAICVMRFDLLYDRLV